MNRVAVVAVAIAAFIGAAVGLSSFRTGSGDVELLLTGSPDEVAAFRELVGAFHASRSDTRVRLVNVGSQGDLQTRLSTAFAAGTPPDLFLINYRHFAQYAARGLIEPIDDELARTGGPESVQFFSVSLDAFRYHGSLYCMAQNVSSLALYYNRSLFRQAGVAEPADDWSWDDLVASARRLVRDGNGDGTADQFGLAVEPILIRLAPLAWSNDGKLVDSDNAPTRLVFDEPNSRHALERFLELGAGADPNEPEARVAVIPGEAAIESESAEGMFLNGRLAMLITSRRPTTTFRAIDAFEWDVAPMPFHRHPANVLHTDGYCISAASPRKEKAWRFIEFAVSQRGQEILAATGRIVPSFQAVAESESFLDPNQPPSRARVFLDAIPTVRRLPVISTWPEIEDRANEILEQGLYEQLPVDEVIRLLDERTREPFMRSL